MIARRSGRSHRRWRPLCWRSTTTSPGIATSCAARRAGAATRGERRAGDRLPRDRRPCIRRAAARPPRRECSDAGRLAREGSHRLERWETDWSSQTGACQAGLLHGDNHDMPAFRWWEKDRDRPIVTNHPRDAEELERRHSNGRGLLHADGASRANILSGDARPLDADDEHGPPPPPADRARLRGLLRASLRRGAHLALSLADIARERRAAATSGARRSAARSIIAIARYAVVRAWATVSSATSRSRR